MKKLALFPTWVEAQKFTQTNPDRFPKDEFDILVVEDRAAYKLEGLRFTDVWIHWWCFQEPEYESCVHLIRHMQCFSETAGESHLFA